MYRFTENRPQHQPEETDAERAYGTGAGPVLSHEAGADHHLAPGVFQAFEDPRDIARIVLAIAIHANDVAIAELPGEFVACLDAAAKAQVVRQGQQVGARRARDEHGAIRGT